MSGRLILIFPVRRDRRKRPAATAENGEAPIRVALASVLSPQDTIGYYRQVARYISQETGRPVALIQRKTYEEVNLLLANQHADIAFLSTGAYSAYRGMAEIEMLVMQEYQGSSMYMTDVIVHKDSNIRSIEDLRGKVFAFTDPLSYSGHVVIAHYLRNRQELPESYFGRYIYTYNHDKSLWAVATKVVDGACLDSMITAYAATRTPELAANIRCDPIDWAGADRTVGDQQAVGSGADSAHPGNFFEHAPRSDRPDCAAQFAD